MDTNFIQNNIEKIKNIYEIVLKYLETDDELSDIKNYENLHNYIGSQKLDQNKYNLKIVFHLLTQISNNHYRTINFYDKIEKILFLFQDDIKYSFSNWEIFNIFKSSKRILLFLFKNNILVPDKSIFYIMREEKYEKKNYLQYFSTEFIQFNNFKANESEPELFESKRKIGENDNNLCNLIRNDLVKEFIILFNKTNFSLNSEIDSSIFETNSFLFGKKTTLIQYSAFFGSIQIFQFLILNGVCLEPSIWKYAIHGKNAEIIHLLEENDVNIEINQLLNESIKCHHNEISKYIQDKFIIYNEQIDYNKNEYKLILQKLKYYNFKDFPYTILVDSELFYYLCKYDYVNIVEFLLLEGKIKIEWIIIISQYFL